MEQAVFSKTKRGMPALYDCDGYRYVKTRASNHVVYWRCEFSLKKKCPGSAITEGFYIKCKKQKHTHRPGERIFVDSPEKIFVDDSPEKFLLQ
jgi:hypothetical protein